MSSASASPPDKRPFDAIDARGQKMGYAPTIRSPYAPALASALHPSRSAAALRDLTGAGCTAGGGGQMGAFGAMGSGGGPSPATVPKPSRQLSSSWDSEPPWDVAPAPAAPTAAATASTSFNPATASSTVAMPSAARNNSPFAGSGGYQVLPPTGAGGPTVRFQNGQQMMRPQDAQSQPQLVNGEIRKRDVVIDGNNVAIRSVFLSR